MFQFPRFAPYSYFTQNKVMGRYAHGVAPFGYVWIKARLAAPHTLSWPSPSFFASHVPRHPSRAFSRSISLPLTGFFSPFPYGTMRYR